MSPKVYGPRSLTHVRAKLSRGDTDIVASIPQNRVHPYLMKKEEVDGNDCITE